MFDDSCTICFKIIRNGKWNIFVADISNQNCQPSWILKISLTRKLPVSSLSDFLLPKYMIRSEYCKIYSKLKLGSGQHYFLLLPFSEAGFYKIAPKGTYNHFFIFYIIISLLTLSSSINTCTRMRNFVFWSVYSSTTCYMMQNEPFL